MFKLGKLDVAKGQRRTRIIDAAEQLVRQTKSTDFSMKELAETAGLSTATTYNLIGSKATVLYVLLNRSIDQLSENTFSLADSGSPVDRIEQSTRIAVEFFSGDPGFYRPLMRFLLGVPDPVHRPAFMNRAFDLWLQAFRPLADEYIVPAGVTAEDFARTLNIIFTGALDLWVHEELNNAQFEAQLSQSLWLLLLTLPSIDATRAQASLAASRKALL